MTRTALYRHFDVDGALLYVGITCGLGSRDTQHLRNESWFPEVHHSTTEWLNTREHARSLERVAIVHESPKYNIANAKGEIRVDGDAESIEMDAIRVMDQHAAKYGISVSTIGQMSVRNRNAYDRIKAGTAHRITSTRILDWIADDRIARGTPQ